MSNKLYDILKWVGLICLPAVAWFVSVIAPVWGIPNADAVVTTLNAAGTLLGVLIGASTIDYNKRGKTDDRA